MATSQNLLEFPTTGCMENFIIEHLNELQQKLHSLKTNRNNRVCANKSIRLPTACTKFNVVSRLFLIKILTKTEKKAENVDEKLAVLAMTVLLRNID